jgi:leucyl-tRNA synthetase
MAHKVSAENWIAEPGLQFCFRLASARGVCDIEVFTTRPDTIFGASFVAISPGHPIAEALAAERPEVADFIAKARAGGTSAAEIETAEKLGYDTGLEVIHPFDENMRLPVWIADYVLMEYGTGAIFGSAAHDQRDLDFARKYGPPVLRVVAPSVQQAGELVGNEADLRGGVIVNSRSRRNGRGPGNCRSHQTRRNRRLGPGQRSIGARLGRFAPALLGLPDPDHPLRNLRQPAGTRRAVARRAADDVSFDSPVTRSTAIRPGARSIAPMCAPARRGTDTLDTFVDSSWYFIRCQPDGQPFDRRSREMLPVGNISAVEHAILHLLTPLLTRALDGWARFR